MVTEPQVSRKTWAFSIWRGTLPPALNPDSRLPQAPGAQLTGSWKRQPSPTNPPCKPQLTELIWARSGATLGLIYNDRIKADSFQHHGRAFHSALARRARQNRNEKGGSAVAAGFSFGEHWCSPKHHPTARLHCSMCSLCSCPALSLAGAGGGEGSAFPGLSCPLSLGLGAREHSSASRLQLPAHTSPCSGQL